MGIPCRRSIEETELGWRCHKCQCPLARTSDHINGDFMGRLGPAVFLGKVINIDREHPQIQNMTSGRYTVQYVNCHSCHSYLGWGYIKSFSSAYGYKVGKFCLEVNQIDHVPRVQSF